MVVTSICYAYCRGLQARAHLGPSCGTQTTLGSTAGCESCLQEGTAPSLESEGFMGEWDACSTLSGMEKSLMSSIAPSSKTVGLNPPGNSGGIAAHPKPMSKQYYTHGSSN